MARGDSYRFYCDEDCFCKSYHNFSEDFVSWIGCSYIYIFEANGYFGHFILNHPSYICGKIRYNLYKGLGLIVF